LNRQTIADERSYSLHREVIKKLKNNPVLWNIPTANLDRWKNEKNGLTLALLEWEDIFKTKTKEQILSILNSNSEDSIRLRSSSPFTGILNQKERLKIFKSFVSKKKKA